MAGQDRGRSAEYLPDAESTRRDRRGSGNVCHESPRSLDWQNRVQSDPPRFTGDQDASAGVARQGGDGKPSLPLPRESCYWMTITLISRSLPVSRCAYVNGRYLPLRQAAVNVEDRGYQF